MYGPEVGEDGPEELELEPIEDEGETSWLEARRATLFSGTDR